MNLDIQHIEALLSIVEKSAAHGGKLSSLGAWATVQLMEINETIRLDDAARALAEKEKTAAEGEADRKKAAQAGKDAGINPEDDHRVDPDLGAPRARPSAEFNEPKGRRA